MNNNVTSGPRFAPLIVIVIAIVGVGFTELLVEYGLYYWGAACIVFAILFSVQANRQSPEGHVVQHILHWLGSIGALAITYLFVHVGKLDASQSGLVSVLILALAMFTDGIRVHSRYAIIGVYLFVTAGVMAYIESFVWWFVMIAFLAIGFEVYWLRKAQKEI